MLISHSKQFIFIHVYKVAGTSIGNALSKYCDYSSKSKNPMKLVKRTMGLIPNIYINDFPGHITAKDLKERIPENIFSSYFKFAFVRNSWDWQVSLYKFALQTPHHHQHELTKSFGSFEKYLEWRVNEDLHLQKEFVTNDDGEIILDFVGKMETLNNDFKIICESLSLPQVILPHANKSNRQSSDQYYTSYSSSLIEKYFAEDIELFGYSRPF